MMSLEDKPLPSALLLCTWCWHYRGGGATCVPFDWTVNVQLYCSILSFSASGAPVRCEQLSVGAILYHPTAVRAVPYYVCPCGPGSDSV